MQASAGPTESGRLCECGCGTPVKRRFVRGHHLNGNKFSEGDRSWLWKGDNVGYKAVHRWLERHKPRTGICQRCGRQPKPVAGSRKKVRTEFANISGEYKRDVNDYIELCVPCHKRFERS